MWFGQWLGATAGQWWGDGAVEPPIVVVRRGGGTYLRRQKRRRPEWEPSLIIEQAELLLDEVADRSITVDAFIDEYVEAFREAAEGLRALVREAVFEREVQRAKAALAEIKETLEAAQRVARQQQDDETVLMLFVMARRAHRKRILH